MAGSLWGEQLEAEESAGERVGKRVRPKIPTDIHIYPFSLWMCLEEPGVGPAGMVHGGNQWQQHLHTTPGSANIN